MYRNSLSQLFNRVSTSRFMLFRVTTVVYFWVIWNKNCELYGIKFWVIWKKWVKLNKNWVKRNKHFELHGIKILSYMG